MIDTRTLSEYLNIAEPTVRRWRREGKGPAFLRLGGSIRYRPEEVEKWIEQQQEGTR